MSVPECLIRTEGRAGRITLNRPDALNALTYGMIMQITATLDTWRNNPAVAIVILDGTGHRAMCAGGDVLSLYAGRQDPARPWRQFWRDEYRLNAAIHRYPKPFLAIMDGIVMGGGIGLSAHAAYRVVTERSTLAMPETSIGLIPDVGGTYLLSRTMRFKHLSDHTGTYLALTGKRFNGADALVTGFADICIHSKDIPALLAEVIDGPEQLPGTLVRYNSAIGDVPGEQLYAAKAEIDRAFGFDTIEAILAVLDAGSTPWTRDTAALLRTKSPKALKLTLAALRQAQKFNTLEAALNVEYRLVNRLYEDGEFIEGVRALLIDKDKTPKWLPARLEDMTPAMIAAFLAPLAGGSDLNLAAP